VVIDTSAIVAIALNEPDAPEIVLRIADDPIRLIDARIKKAGCRRANFPLLDILLVERALQPFPRARH
jgi:hypothetical protein